MMRSATPKQHTRFIRRLEPLPGAFNLPRVLTNRESGVQQNSNSLTRGYNQQPPGKSSGGCCVSPKNGLDWHRESTTSQERSSTMSHQIVKVEYNGSDYYACRVCWRYDTMLYFHNRKLSRLSPRDASLACTPHCDRVPRQGITPSFLDKVVTAELHIPKARLIYP